MIFNWDRPLGQRAKFNLVKRAPENSTRLTLSRFFSRGQPQWSTGES